MNTSDYFYNIYNLFKENIVPFSSLVAIIFGIINLYLLRITIHRKEDETLFNLSTKNLTDAIKILEAADPPNNAHSWNVAAEMLSSFHNIAIKLDNKELRRCYCAKLNSYVLRLANLLNKIDNYRFFYGVPYNNIENSQILFSQRKYISTNALGCLIQFLTIIHGARGDYITNDKEINKLLHPVFYGFPVNFKEQSQEEIEKMPQPFNNIYRYMNEWSILAKEQRPK